MPLSIQPTSQPTIHASNQPTHHSIHPSKADHIEKALAAKFNKQRDSETDTLKKLHQTDTENAEVCEI